MVLISLIFPAGSVQAISAPALRSILKYSSHYGEEEEADKCSALSGLTTTGKLPGGVPEPYNEIITAASEKFGANGNLVAAVFYWENRSWPPEDKDWATSPAGAQGPMQFLPTTFAAYNVDGDGDGKTDINNVFDAIYSGANMISANGGKVDTPLGSLEKPLAPNTLLRVAASYNWGGGNVQSAGENASLDNLPQETSDYLKAVYALISSEFKQSPQSGSTATPPPTDGESSTGDAATTCGSGQGIPGNGSGKFIDSTSITVPGADQAIAKAQAIAKYSPPQLQAICDGSPNCYQRCERLAAVVWGRTSSGYETANIHWDNAPAGSKHVNDRNVPVGALLYYDTGSSSGHVATYLGNNLILSNDVSDTANEGGAYIVDAKAMEAGPWHLTYLGWVNPVPWGR